MGGLRRLGGSVLYMPGLLWVYDKVPYRGPKLGLSMYAALDGSPRIAKRCKVHIIVQIELTGLANQQYGKDCSVLFCTVLYYSGPGMWGASLVVNLLVGSPQPSARRACSMYPPSASLCLSSQPANSASQPASQLPGRNSACGYIGALVVILLVGMLLEWS